MENRSKIKIKMRKETRKMISPLLSFLTRVAIWNVTAKQVTLITSDPQMSGDRDPWS